MFYIKKYGNTETGNFQFFQCNHCGCEFYSNEFVFIEDDIAVTCPECDGQITRSYDLDSHESISNVINANNWISVYDRLPDHLEDGMSCYVLVYVKCNSENPRYKSNEGIYTGFHCLYDGESEWITKQHNMIYGADVDGAFEVTHWQPLPEIPKG